MDFKYLQHTKEDLQAFRDENARPFRVSEQKETIRSHRGEYYVVG